MIKRRRLTATFYQLRQAISASMNDANDFGKSFATNGAEAPIAWPPIAQTVNLDYAAMIGRACGVPPEDTRPHEWYWDEKLGSWSMRPVGGAPPLAPMTGPEPARPGESQHDYIVRQQQKRAEESARHVAAGEAREREKERLAAGAAR
jgi:hypothetical protein